MHLKLLGSLFVLLGLTASQGSIANPVAGGQDDDATIVYLVRHAERATDDPRDPNLSEAGRVRTQRLTALLRDANLDHVYSTDLRRTRQTAGPVADGHGLEIETYDPRELEAFARSLAGTSGRLLVSGHSNTTPELVGYLGGDAHGTIEEWEYDRLYVVILQPGRAVTTLLLRYGGPSAPRQE